MDRIRLGIDVGGTFTDLMALDEGSGEVILVKKVPSDPGGWQEGITDLLQAVRGSLPGRMPSHILYGSTVGLNTLLEGSASSPALITTEGFKDIYELGRLSRGGDVYNLFFDRPAMLLPRRQIFEVSERVNFCGEVIKPLLVEQVKRLMPLLRDQGFQAVAVCLLFSYVNPVHERQIASLLQQELPDLYLSLSAEVNPQWREYERTCTTVANAYLGPKVAAYLRGLEEERGKVFPGASLLMMQSNGGVTTPGMLSRFPVNSLMSGPVAGVIGASYVGGLLGVNHVISLDVGGTSCDMSLLPGEVLFRPESRVGGHLIRVNTVDVQTIGSGGGSIAHLEFGRVLKVGPQSAGAIPGPACYGKGGKDPTLTDALVILGHLNPHALLGGEMPISRGAAEQAIVDRLARPLDLPLVEAAHAILRVLIANVTTAMRSITIERGYDPREFALVAFGGVGPTLALPVSQELGIGRVIIPPTPGNFCAFGMLVTDLCLERTMTRISLLEDFPLGEMEQTFSSLEQALLVDLKEAGVSAETTRMVRSLDMRYSGQSYDIAVPVASQLVDGSLEQLRAAFHGAHARRYGYRAEGEWIEVVNFRVRAICPLATARPQPPAQPKIALGPPPSGAGVEGTGPVPFRQVYFDGRAPAQLTPIWHREQLRPGQSIRGPAVIEEMTSTTVLYPGYVASVDGHGNVLIEPLPVLPVGV